MKTLFTILASMVLTFSHAQEYYYNGSEKVVIYPSTDAYILFDNLSLSKTLKSQFGKTESFPHKGYTLLEEKEGGFSMQAIGEENRKHLIPAYSLENGGKFKMFPTKTARVKLKSGRNQKDLSPILSKYDIVNIEEKYGIIRVHINDISQIFKIANAIYESGLVEFSVPDFYIEKTLNQAVNDPLFPLQYQMNNTGQIVDGFAGVNDIDCNALEAWGLTLGNNITVAVIDQGLEAHEDFGNRLIGGHTPATNGDGTPLTNLATHGMNSAGVAAASANNLGVRGVAPNVNLLSVNIFSGGETDGDIADGITWAVNNGADVISNSWGAQNAPCGFSSVQIDNAIQFAVTSGRGGNGAVVVFAAGNLGGCVEYPAANSNVIAVGAIDNQGNQYDYSARGPQLDLVAPSGDRFNGVGVRTLDRMGAAGNFLGNYRNDFDGTSASCPVVSGAAALVLSVNPNLTQQQVRNILTQTATDMGQNGFDNNFGHGRVNACAAVLSALQPSMSVTGSSILCTSGSQFVLNGAPAGSSVTWAATPSHLFLVSSGSGGAPTIAASSSGIGLGTITFTIDAGCGRTVQTQRTM
jgi:hypothetical protein